MNQNWMSRNRPPTPANPAQPAQPGPTGTGGAIQLIEDAILQDDAFLMRLIQRMTQVAQRIQQPQGQPPAPPTGGMPGG
jgi:hypothetical protein